LVCINEIQQDVTVCTYLFTASLLYMFRASIMPIIRSTKNCNAASGTGHSNGAMTFLCGLYCCILLDLINTESRCTEPWM